MRTFKLFIFVLSMMILSCSKDDSDTIPIINNPNGNLNLESSTNQSSIQKIVDFYLTSFSGSAVNIDWDFGDGNTFYGSGDHTYAKHIFEVAGNYNVKAKVYFSNNNVVTVNKNITITNGNRVKVTKITILNYPNKYCIGSSGNFYGSWDEDYNYLTSNVNRLSDTFIKIGREVDTPNSDDPREIDYSKYKYLYTAPIIVNQTSNIFDVSNQNIYLNLDVNQQFILDVYDSDAQNSMSENGTTDDYISGADIYMSSFSNNNFTWSSGTFQLKIEYVNM